MISSERLGERLAQARKRLGKNQKDVAESLGIARTTLVAMEKGERRPSNTELLQLARILSLSMNELLREHTVVAETSPRFLKLPLPQKARSAEVEEAVEQLKQLGRQYVELEQVLCITRTPAPLEAITTYRAASAPLGIAPRLLGQDAANKGAHFSAADLIAMTRFHGVTFPAMTLRLEALELLPSGTYQGLMRRKFRPPSSAGRWLPARYERLALEAYSQELLSERELARYLGCDRVTARDLYLSRQIQAAEGGELVLELGEVKRASPPGCPRTGVPGSTPNS